MSGPESTEKVAERLRITRLALGFPKQIDICRDLGDEGLAQAWNNWEKGRERISVNSAIALVRKYRLTLDWIFLGIDDGIPAKVARQIEEIRAKKVA